MAKPEWGVKRICRECDISFYDMKRTPAKCPKCETIFEPQDQPKKASLNSEKDEEKNSDERLITQEDDDLVMDDSTDDNVPGSFDASGQFRAFKVSWE